MDPQHPVDIEKLTSSEPSVSIPTNPIITSTIESIKDAEGLIPSEQLSSTGKKVLSSVEQALTDSQRLLEEKNNEEQLQRAYALAQEIIDLQNSEIAKKAFSNLKENFPSSNINYSSDLIGFVKSLINDSEFRNLIFEATNLGQQLILIFGRKFEKDVENIAEAHREDEKAISTEQISSYAEAAAEDVKGISEKAREDPIANDALNQFGKRLLDLLRKVQEKPEYQNALDQFYDQIDSFSFWQREDLSQVREKLESDEIAVIDQSIKKIHELGVLLKQLIQNFANTNIDDLIELWKEIINEIQTDTQARSFFSEFGLFSCRCLRDKEFISDEESVINGVKHLNENAKQVMEKHRPRLEHLIRQIRYVLDRMRRDPFSQRLGEDLGSLTSHLFYDQSGNPVFKPELLFDLQKVIPAILKGLRYIKIPDIKVHEPGLDFVASNIVVSVGELAPHHLRLVVTSDLPEGEAEIAKNRIDFEMSRIHAQADNIKFILRKTGIPPLDDTGLADFRVFEDGMQVFLRLEPIIGTITGESEPKLAAGLQIIKCECRLKYFDLSIHKSGHDWMYYLLGPYIRRMVKERIEDAIVKYFMELDLITSMPIPEKVASSI